jgi:hypothetical protein
MTAHVVIKVSFCLESSASFCFARSWKSSRQLIKATQHPVSAITTLGPEALTEFRFVVARRLGIGLCATDQLGCQKRRRGFSMEALVASVGMASSTIGPIDQ